MGVEEVQRELLKQDPTGGQVNDLSLASATARLNARIRSRGLSAREMLFQRDQFTNDQIPLQDMDLITEQHQAKLKNHHHSEKSKAPNKNFRPETHLTVGDLVHLHHDASKLKSRDRYIVAAVDSEWVYIRKFVGRQLRNNSYKVKRSECYKVPVSLPFPLILPSPQLDDEYDENLGENTSTSLFDDHRVHEVVENSSNHDRQPVSPQNSSESEGNIIPEVVADLLPPVEQEVIPDTIVPSLSQVGMPTTRPKRACKPPDRLCVNWGNKSYT